MTSFLCCLSVWVAAEKQQMGCGGTIWRKLEERDEQTQQLVKIVLIRGIYEGAWFTDIDKAKDRLYQNAKYSELGEALDEFYSDVYNVKIPIYYALEIVAMKYKGISSKNIEKRIKELRYKWANNTSGSAYLVK